MSPPPPHQRSAVASSALLLVPKPLAAPTSQSVATNIIVSEGGSGSCSGVLGLGAALKRAGVGSAGPGSAARVGGVSTSGVMMHSGLRPSASAASNGNGGSGAGEDKTMGDEDKDDLENQTIDLVMPSSRINVRRPAGT